MLFRLMFVHCTLCLVWVAECTTFWKTAAHSVGHLFSFSFVYLYFFIYFPFWFLEWDLAFDCPSSCSLARLYLFSFKQGSGSITENSINFYG